VVIAVLIPAHDEAERIERTIEAARAIDGVTRVVVIDDGSTDATAELAEGAGARVVRLQRNVGKGAALDAGAKRVEDADVVLLLDADLAETAQQGARLLAPSHGDADLAIAAFRSHKARPASASSREWLAGHRTHGGGFEAAAPLSGQRALSRHALEAVLPFSTGYGVEVTMTVRALRAGLKIVEVPTTMTHAATGRDIAGFVHRGRQFTHVVIALVRVAFERRP